MTSIENIIATVKSNSNSVSLKHLYPDKPGLYVFSLAQDSELKEFGKSGQILYVGKAEESLRDRIINKHLKNGNTGQSSLRRSLGAILKKELSITVFSRNCTLNKPNIDNYKFNYSAELLLTEWMMKNLIVGYWQYFEFVEKRSLRNIEIDLNIAILPTLDLDKQTSKYNKNKESLTALRKICKEEASMNVKNSTKFF